MPPLASHSNSSTMSNDLARLPAEVLRHIVALVKTDSYAIVGSVCRGFRDSYTHVSEKVTRFSKYTQSPALFHLATSQLGIEFSDSHLLDNLISRNEIEIIPLVLARGLEWDHFCVESAAACGCRDFFVWIMKAGLPWLPENAHASAASNGDLAMMMFLVESGAGYPDARSQIVAAKLGHHHISRWMGELRLIKPEYALVEAARANDACFFEWSGIEGLLDHESYITVACVNGSLDVLEVFRTTLGVGPTAEDVATAVFFKQYSVFEWCSEFFQESLH